MISVDLGVDLEAFATELVATGRYNSINEVLRDAARLIQDREARLEAFDVAIASGLAQADAGLGTPAEEVLERLERKYRAILPPQ
jgi:antitoxin ParD1/3/4